MNIKGANKDMPRFMLEGPRSCRIFAHCYRLVPQYGVNNYCVLCRVQAQKSEQKHTKKNFDEFHNYSPLLAMVKQNSV